MHATPQREKFKLHRFSHYLPHPTHVGLTYARPSNTSWRCPQPIKTNEIWTHLLNRKMHVSGMCCFTTSKMTSMQCNPHWHPVVFSELASPALGKQQLSNPMFSCIPQVCSWPERKARFHIRTESLLDHHRKHV